MAAALHQRTVIRRAVRALLIAANTSAGANVTTTRLDPYPQTKLPAISVYTISEDVDDVSAETSPRELTRDVEVEIVGFLAQVEAMDDALDALALEIETAMHADPYFGGLVSDSILTGSELKIHRESERLIGIAVLTYKVTYRTLAPGAPVLVDFITAHTATDVGVPEEAQRAVDVVTLPQESP